MSLFWILFWLGLGLLLLTAGVRLRVRIRRHWDRPRATVDDEAVRRILEDGILITEEDEPLDLEDIREEERRFWEEEWDEPEPW